MKPLLAALVYLHCSLNPGTQPDTAPMDVTLNEAEATVTYTFPNIGRTFIGPAAFGASDVSFNGFRIDRNDLTYSRTMLSKVDRGQCAIVQPGKAF